MRSNIYWVATLGSGRLGIMARPRAGDWLEDEVRSLRDARVDVVVSLLTSEEESELGLTNEAEVCAAAGLKFVALPIRDRGVPEEPRATLQFVDSLCAEIKSGRSVVTHCRMGIGRSSLIAASVMVRLGVGFDEAWEALSAARGLRVPDTEEQREWVRSQFAS